MKKIVLFDMDGTLTPPRQELDRELLKPLKALVNFCQIGVVTGSDIEYLNQQLHYLLINSEIRYKAHLLPCNGTKHYIPPQYNHQSHELIYESCLKKEIGKNNFNRVMRILIDYQNHISSHYQFPLTGHFISYRNSMINWSPIGRNANIDERGEFVHMDKNFPSGEFRKIIVDQLREEFRNIHLNLTVKMGGETSFDIYPLGWDKTHSLKHFKDYDVWFVCDKCDNDGNDREIYEKLQPDRSFKVSNTKETKKIIYNLISMFG